MKSSSTAMQGHLSGDVTTLCRLYKFTRKDGTVYTFTDHDQNLDTTPYQGTPPAGFDDGLGTSPPGGYVYEAAIGFNPTATENKSDLTVDNQEVTAFIDSETIEEKDIRFGVWDGTSVEIRVVNWADLSQGQIKVRYGTLGDITMKNGVATFQLLGLTNLLQTLQGRSFGPRCDAELGDLRCKAVVPTQNGSVLAAVDAHNFQPHSGLVGAAGFYSSLTEGSFIVPNASGVANSGQSGSAVVSATGSTMLVTDTTTDNDGNTTYVFVLQSGPPPKVGDSVTVTLMTSPVNDGTWTISEVGSSLNAVWTPGFFDDGILTFTSGVNSGLSYQIKQWDGIVLKLDNAMFVAPSPGDTFVISPGCDHTTGIGGCGKFAPVGGMTVAHGGQGNIANFRGFPTIPGQDSILQYPNATG